MPLVEVTPKEPGYTATAWWKQGCYGFNVLDSRGLPVFNDDGSISQQGGNREIRSLGALYAASRPWIDWNTYDNAEAGTKLARADREHWDEETRRALDRVLV